MATPVKQNRAQRVSADGVGSIPFGRRIAHRVANSSIIRSAGSRIIVLPISGVAAVAVARLVSSSAGADGFALYTLVATLPALIPFTDLGTGAALTNAAPLLSSAPSEFWSVYGRVRRMLIQMALLLIVVNLAFAIWGIWPILLGVAGNDQVNLGAFACLTLYLCALPFGVGAPVLIGLGKNAYVIFVQGIAPLVSLLWVAIAVVAHFSLAALMVGGSLPTLIAAVWVHYAALRFVGGRPKQKSPLAATSHVLRTGWAMIVITIAVPISLQSGRVVLTWTAGLATVSVFAAAMVVFLPVFSVAQLAGRSLWADFATERARAQTSWPTLLSGWRTSGMVGALLAIALIALGPVVLSIAVGSTVHVPLALLVIFSGVILAQALHLPAGMYLTYERGLRFQAVTTLCMAIVVIGLSITLAPLMGYYAPATGLLVGLTFCQLLPCAIYAFLASRAGIPEVGAVS